MSRTCHAKRLLLMSSDYPPAHWSGIGVAVRRQAKALAAMGHDVHVLCPTLPSDAERTERGEDQTGTLHAPVLHRLGRRLLPVDPREFDHLHLHSLGLAPLALEIQRRFDLPLTVTVHGLVHRELQNGEGAPWLRQTEDWSRLQAEVLQRADRVVFLSRDELEAGLSWQPRLRGRALCIGNGVHPGPRLPAAAAEPHRIGADLAAGAPVHGLTEHSRRKHGPIVFAGRFARSKGLDLLAELAPQLLAEQQRPILFAGGHGDRTSKERVRKLCHESRGRCRSLGWLSRPALDRLLGQAALVLAPSRYEPFGLVALEAQRMGCPVLVSPVGGLREQSEAGSGAMGEKSRHPAAWVRGALDILEQPRTWQSLSQRGPDFVRRRYCIDDVARRLSNEAYAA